MGNSAMATGAALSAVFLLPVLGRHFGDVGLLCWGYFAYGLASAMLAYMPSEQCVALSVLPFSLGVAVLRSTPAAFFSRRLPATVQGEALGLLDAVSSTLRVFCPLAC